jgi:hypothetical protein
MKLLRNAKYAHPYYQKRVDEWEKYRHVLEGGDIFIDEYLQKYSSQEDDTDFQKRKSVTYCPAHAEAALMDIRNTIYQRMQEIVRKTSLESYELCIKGKNGGVDGTGDTMDGFIGRTVLTELLFLGRVGVFVDRSSEYSQARTKAEKLQNHPYCYIVKTEDIISWKYDADGELETVLIAFEEEVSDNELELVTGTEHKFKYLRRTESGVEVTIYDSSMGIEAGPIVLKLRHIPFTILETSRPLLKNIAGYQVALLNMESSDVSYSIRSNFTFYTEQYDPRYDAFTAGATVDEATGSISKSTQTDLTIKTGHAVGRRYAIDTERPGFIHPSPEPLRASMEKEETIRQDIHKLINLNMSMLEPTRASAESKKLDTRGLESGLSCIGMELELLERHIVRAWADYEGKSDTEVLIKYPSSYSPKSDEDRINESEKYLDLAEKATSNTYRREMCKRAISILLYGKVQEDTLDKIYNEIDENPAVLSGVQMIIETHREGLVSDALAAMLLGYPDGDVVQANKDHAERAARIVLAQTSAKDKARGVDDLDPDKTSDLAQKQKVTETDFDQGTGKRGEAK